jgi:spore maturation protein CgeB
MRLIRITTNHPNYLNQFYSRFSGLAKQSYTEQYRVLMADCYGWADFWTHAFGKLGYEVWEPVGNAEPAQKKWALENGVAFGEKTWLFDIVTAQVKQFGPDVVFVNDYSTYNAEFFNRLRDTCPSIRCVIGWCGAPFSDDRVFKAYDLVLSNISCLVAYFRNRGLRCEYLHHAFEPRILDRINSDSEPTTDFSFLGSIVKAAGYHNQREALLKRICQKTDLKIWSNVRRPSNREMHRLPLKQKIYDAVQSVKSFPGGRSLLEMVPRIKHYVSMKERPNLDHYTDAAVVDNSQPALYGLAMFQKLHDSKVSLNTHIDISTGHASNMRLFEATGVGSCLMTEWQPNLSDLLEPDFEIITYRSAEEAVEKKNYLLDHEAKRRKIATAGQHRTLRHHNFSIRARQIDAWIREFLK